MSRLGHRFAARSSSALWRDRRASVTSTRNGGVQSVPRSRWLSFTWAMTDTLPRSRKTREVEFEVGVQFREPFSQLVKISLAESKPQADHSSGCQGAIGSVR